MKMSNLGFAGLALTAAFGLAACGLDSGTDSNGSGAKRISTYETVFVLPTCDDKTNNGLQAYVQVDGGKDLYVCRDEWMKQLDGGDEEPIYPDDYRTPLSMGRLPNGLVILGTQVWQSKNVNVSEDADGNTIGHCYEDEEDNCTYFGRLYNWAEAMALDSSYLHKKPSSTVVKKNHQGVCPEGFHIPNGAEIDTLYNYVDKTRAASDYRKEMDRGIYDASGAMLRTPNTSEDGVILWADEAGTIPGLDVFGMSFVGAGMATPYEKCDDDGENCGIEYEYTDLTKFDAPWLSNIDDNENHALNARLNYNTDYAERDWWDKDRLHTVRCIMNKTAAEYKATDEYKKMLEEALAEEGEDEGDSDEKAED